MTPKFNCLNEQYLLGNIANNINPKHFTPSFSNITRTLLCVTEQGGGD